jgi:hypothetical protein
MALVTSYDDESLDLSRPVEIHTDRFSAVPLNPVDLSRFSWPAAMGPRRLDPLDADILSPEVLAAARANPRAGLTIPSAAIVDSARAAERRGALEAVVLRPTEGARSKPTVIRDVVKRSEATREALRGARLNFLNRPEYAEDKGLSWAAEQELIQRGEAAARARELAAAERDADEALPPLARVEASFTRCAAAPVHPRDASLRPVEVLELVPDEALCYAASAGEGLVWADFTRLEDAAVDPDDAVAVTRLRDAARAPGKTGVDAAARLGAAAVAARAADRALLAWTFARGPRATAVSGIVTAADNAARAGVGGVGLYRPVSARALAGEKARAAAARRAAAGGDTAAAELAGEEEEEEDDGLDIDEELELLESGGSGLAFGGGETSDDEGEDAASPSAAGAGAGMRDGDDDDGTELSAQSKRARAGADYAGRTGGRVRNSAAEADAAAADVKALTAAAAAGPSAAAAADAALAGQRAVVGQWLRELSRAPVADLEGDDNYFFVFEGAGADAPVDADGVRRGVVRYGRMRHRVSLRKRIASAQDPCDKTIKARPAHIVLRQQ